MGKNNKSALIVFQILLGAELFQNNYNKTNLTKNSYFFLYIVLFLPFGSNM